ncbi:acetyltransferase-like isoleucine patch superfamily enzyme [Pontivivens insulae]|nr:acetyltransferase-like isoleucine patch superfamily enzyme [Pontivivens insulae]
MPDPTKDRIRKFGESKMFVGRFTYGDNKIVVRQWGEGASATIGSFCSIADGVVFMLGGNHRVDWITTFPFGHIFRTKLGKESVSGHPTTRGDIVVGHDVWIGENSVVMSGVQIGNGAVVAAESVVTNDIAPYEIWGGNPARKIKDRFDPEIVDALLQLSWWELELDTIRKISPKLLTAPTLEGIAEIAQMIKAAS